MKITKLRINIESGQFNHIVKPQCFDESSGKWKDFMDSNRPVRMLATRGKVHGMELSHITQKNIERARRKASIWLEKWKKDNNHKDLIIEKIEPKKKSKVVKKKKKKKLGQRCDKCGAPVKYTAIPRPEELLCAYCKTEGKLNIDISPEIPEI